MGVKPVEPLGKTPLKTGNGEGCIKENALPEPVGVSLGREKGLPESVCMCSLWFLIDVSTPGFLDSWG